MRRFVIWVFLLIGLAGCASPATPAPIPPTQAPPKAETDTAVAAPRATSTQSSAASCATTNAAPPNEFRADDPAKFAANTGKPKLVEFFAFW